MKDQLNSFVCLPSKHNSFIRFCGTEIDKLILETNIN